MKIVVLDGYTENPGDLSWEPLGALGDLVVYDRTSYEESDLIAERIGDAEIVVMNKTPISRATLDKCPNIKLIAVLATGGSAEAAISEMKKRGCVNIKLMVLLAAPEGIEHLQKTHPDVDIYCGAVDDHLNEHGYIVPGLGDAGDRIFGTK